MSRWGAKRDGPSCTSPPSPSWTRWWVESAFSHYDEIYVTRNLTILIMFMSTVRRREVHSLRCESSKLFSSCETETLPPVNTNRPFPTPLSLGHPLFYSLSLWIGLVWVPRMSEVTVRVSLRLVYFPSRNVSEVHPHCSMRQKSLPF